MASPGTPESGDWVSEYVELLNAHIDGQGEDIGARVTGLAKRLQQEAIPPAEVVRQHTRWLSESVHGANGLDRLIAAGGLLQRVLESVARQSDAPNSTSADRQPPASSEILQLALDATTDVLWDWNMVTDELFYSPRHYQLLGYHEREYPRTHAAWCQLIHPDDLGPAREVIQRHIDRRDHGFRVEFRVRARNGQYRWLLGRGRVVERSPDGEPLRMVGTNADINLRKRMEELLRIQRDLGNALSATSSLEEAGRLVLDAGCRVEEVDCGGVYVIDEQTGGLRLIAHRGLGQKFVAAVSNHGPNSPQVQIVRQGKPFYRRHAELAFVDDGQRGERLRALAGLPLLHEGRPIGCMNFGSHVVDGFELEVRESLETLASNMGNVLARVFVEQARRESEARFRMLAENASDIIFRADMDGQFQYISPACERILGRTPEDLAGQSAFDFIAPESMATVEREREQMFSGATQRTFEHLAEHRDGTRRWVETSMRALRDPQTGAFTGVIAVARDIDARKRAEIALRESEARYRLLAEYASDMISRATPDGVWRYVSPACERLLGMRAEELIGRPAYDFFHPDELAHIRRGHEEMLRHERVVTIEQRFRHRDGSWRWTESSGQGVRDPETGVVREIVVVSRDISERKRAEELARQHQIELAHVGRIATIGEMASGLAHELAQPLSAITYFARGARSQVDAGKWSTAQVTDVLARIAAQAERAAEFIRRMKTFVRRGGTEQAIVDLNNVVQEALHFITPEVNTAPVTIETDLATGLPAVRADAIRIEQVVINLVRNSTEAFMTMDTDPAAKPTIRITTANADDGHVMIRCADNGPGIPSNVELDIFEPFVTSKPTGTGLGLSISRSIIEAHGGQLELDAQTPRGACFVITLPVAERGHE